VADAGPDAAVCVGWTIETVGSSAGSLRTGLALGSDGEPRVAHYDADNALVFAKRDASGWTRETVATPTPELRDVSLALDADGRPHIAFLAADPDDVRYAVLDGAGWAVETVADTVNLPASVALAVDTSGSPRVAFLDNGFGVRIASRGTPWTVVDVATGAQYANAVALALDGANNAHLAFHDSDARDPIYATDVSGVFELETVEDAATFGASPALALAGDEIWVAYYDGDAAHLRAAVRSSGGWQATALDTESAGRGVALAAEPDGTLHAVYRATLADDLIYGSGTPASWTREIITQAQASGLSLALAADGTPHVAWYDQTTMALQHAQGCPN
jgi:hypothetical protein